MDRFGWRKMAEHERLASYYFWYEVGKRMGIREIPESYEKLQQFASDYERDNFRFAETNQRIGAATRDLFASWMPRIFAPMVRWIYALLDDAMLASFGFPRPFGFMRQLVSGALKLRGRIVWILPVRKTPNFFTDRRNRTYPRGYEIAELGPPNVDHSYQQSSQHDRES